MKYGYFGFGMLLFGSLGLVVIVMMQAVTINNDSEYYNLKEAMEAAMLESVDYVCYRVEGKEVTPLNEDDNDCGYLLKMSEQKFVENFTRRFVATIGGDAKGYKLDFYDIIESPPKASVIVSGNTKSYGIVSENEGITISNSLSGILQLKRGIGSKYGYYESSDDSASVGNMDNSTSNVKEAETAGGFPTEDNIDCSVVTCEDASSDDEEEDEVDDGEAAEDDETCTSNDDYECDD